MVERVSHARDASGLVGAVRVEGGVAATPAHAHLSLILGRVDAGIRRLTLSDGELDLGPGDGFVIPPDAPHAWAATEGGGHRILVLDPAAFRFPVWRARVIRDAAWGDVFDALHASVEAGESGGRPLAERLLEITDRLVPRAVERKLPPGPAKAARREVQDRLEEALDLSELGRRVGLSPFHLHRLYRATWGLTPAEHRVEARLREARRLLLAGVSPALVAVATGFADQSHLNRAFRRLMGVPPGVWLKQMRKGDTFRRGRPFDQR